tara:strand:+ start:4581 stop:6089 length:1509 start_codon:yes stop_codon:yes gene_type:complete
MAANSRIGSSLINQTGAVARLAFESLGSWRDDDYLRFVRQITPILSGAKMQAAQASVAFYKSMANLDDQDWQQPTISAADLTTQALRNGVTTEQVYRRPFVDVYTALSKGKQMTEAIEAGANRVESLASTEIQLARRNVGLKARNANDRIVGYIRTLTGAENCALCYVASTQRYTRGELMPIHPGCDCGEMPLYGTQDPGQVIDEARLEATHDSIAGRFGVSARDARSVDYRNIKIEQNKELGPVLTIRGQDFTSFDDLQITNTKTYTSIADLVADSENLDAQINSIYNTKLDSQGNGNVPMRALMEQSGKGGKPGLVDTIDDLPGDTVYYRGATSENIDEFMSAERHRIGLGVYGDGYYFSTDQNVADGYAQFSGGTGAPPGKTMAAGIKPDAKIFKIDRFAPRSGPNDPGRSLLNERFKAAGEKGIAELIPKVGNPTDAQDNILTSFFGSGQDAFTTELILEGYDGIEIKLAENDHEKYLVLFNREAVDVVSKAVKEFAE